MSFRLGVVVVVLSCVAATTAHAQVRTTKVEYKSGARATGYDAASFSGRYALHACGGALVITTEFVRGSFYWSDTYWLDGNSYPIPGKHRPTVDDQGTFNGSVRVRGGGSVGAFRSTAGLQSGHGCLGDTSRVADLSQFIDVKDKSAVKAFIASLEVIPDSNSVYRNHDVENAIRRQLADDQRKEDEERKRKEDEERKRKEDEERKRKEDEERQRKEDEERKRKEDEERKRKEDEERDRNEDEAAAQHAKPAGQDEAREADEEAARTKAARDAAEAARKAAEEESARMAKDDARSAKTRWTEADEHDTGYWPSERCSYVDSRGFVHPPPGRHRCDPSYMKKIYAIMKKQADEEEARLRREREAKATRETIHRMSGGTTTGLAVVAGAAAVSPLVDAMGDAANRVNSKFPATLDLEATGRILFTGGTGRGFSMRAPGVIYIHVGFAAFDTGKFDRVRSAQVGLGFQLPMTRAFTIRAFEIGATFGEQLHLIDRSTRAIGVNLRAGALYRLAGGLSFSAAFGIDTAGGFSAFSDLGVLWRFDLRNAPGTSGRYLVR